MFTEPERQALITHIELEEPAETPNNNHYTFYPKTIAEAGVYFRSLRAGIEGATPRLAAAGLLEPGGAHGWQLTESGRVAARAERLAHPPIWYWYRELYPLMARSAAYSRFCQRLYGADFSQAGFSDREQIDRLLAVGAFSPEIRAIDLGCGLGRVAEYLSDCSGARLVGLDYVPEAVALAQERTAHKRDRIAFLLGDLDALSDPSARLEPGSFQRIIAIDTLYMPADLPRTLRAMQALLSPGGQMLIYYSYFRFNPAEPRSLLTAAGSPLGQALTALGLPFRTWDYSEATFHLMRAKRRLAEAMRPEFEAEGMGELVQFLVNESDGGEGDYDPDTWNISRFLYQVG